MTDAARSAMDEVEKKIASIVEGLERQLVEARGMLEHARHFPSATNSNTAGPSVTPGQYETFRPIDALVNYLTTRKGMQIPLQKAVADLIAGGVKPGRPRPGRKDPAGLIEWNIRIGLSQNSDLISWNPPGELEGVPSEEITLWLNEEKKRKNA